MERNLQTKVLVVGAGPVGMLTALLLAQDGIETQIIDQEECTAGRSYACALHPRTLKLLDLVGVAADAIKLGRRVDSVGIYEGTVRRATLKLSELTSEFPFVLVLDQSTLEDLLEERLKRISRIKVNWNHRLADLETVNDRVAVQIEKLAPTAKGFIVPEFEMGVQGTLNARAEYLVAADGHNSRARQLLDINYEERSSPELYVVYEAGCVGDVGHEMKIILEPGKSSVMWPLPNNRCRWSFQWAPADSARDFPEKDRTRYIVEEPVSEENSEHHFKKLLQACAPWFKTDILNVDWATDIQFEGRMAARFGQGRCWLAGDAAHQTGPIGVQSLNEGLWEAADLADKLAQILDGTGTTDLLETYDNEHRGTWRKLLGISAHPKPGPRAEPWIVKYANSMLPKIPASGAELKSLLGQLGLQLD